MGGTHRMKVCLIILSYLLLIVLCVTIPIIKEVVIWSLIFIMLKIILAKNKIL